MTRQTIGCIVEVSKYDTSFLKEGGRGNLLNKRRLEAEMCLNGDTGNTLAAYLNISRSTFSAKLNENRGEFTKREIKAIKTKYNLTAEQVDDIFFAD